MPNLTDPTVQVRRAKVLDLKLKGHSYRAIGPMLGVSRETVRKDLNVVLAELAEDTRSDADQYRAIELDRLDSATRVLLEIMNGEEQEPSVRIAAADKVAKLSESRRKLLGLDAPERHEVGGDMTLTPAAVSGAVREVFRELGSRGAGAGETDAGPVADAQPLP